MNRKTLSLLVLVLILVGTGLYQSVKSQPPGRRRRGVDGPFVGVTARGKVEPGLFKIQATGVDTTPLRKAADRFLAGLSAAQRKRTLFPVDHVEWRQWDNRHFARREGVGFKEMTEAQRELAFAMMRAGLSARGLKKTQDIMKLNGTLAELTKRFDEFGEWLYWITIMGKPSATEPWGWQLDGHHVVINYFVLGDQVVMSPVFMGSEPVVATSGKFKGTRVMKQEQDKGLTLMQALTSEQQEKAIIRGEKGPTNNLSEAYHDNLELDYAGILVSEFNAQQQQLFEVLVEEYIGNMNPGHARVKMSEVKDHLDKTYFAWIGKVDGDMADSVFYYRIHSPVILIEFDHQRPIALGRSRTPTRNHAHSVVRTPNGNDYGKDLLRQHYEQHHRK